VGAIPTAASKKIFKNIYFAEVLELEDSMDLKSIGDFSVRVQVPPSAQKNKQINIYLLV
jgi:hypothetical protein